MMDRAYYVYIVASTTRVIYIGFTGRFRRRILQHKIHAFEGFTDKYCCDRLVWAEMHPDPHAAIFREKQLKGWVRAKKVALIQKENPNWDDLAAEWWDAESILKFRSLNGDKRVAVQDDSE